MAEYDLAFARKFADVAQDIISRGFGSGEDRRVVAYISRLSMELALKAFLEHAGKPVGKIRKLSHNLQKILAEVDTCDVEIEINPGKRQWVSASQLRTKQIPILGLTTVALEHIVNAENQGASQYPNEIRYGDTPKDYPVEALAAAAVEICIWVASHWNHVRLA